MALIKAVVKKYVILFLLISFSGMSQSYFYSVGLGGNLLKGDVQQWNLSPNFQQLKTIRPSLQGEFGIQLDKTFDFRLRLSLGRLNGDALAKPMPNLPTSFSISQPTFSSNLFEVALLADYNFFDFKSDEETWLNWSPYFVTGISGFYANPSYSAAAGQPIYSLAIPYGVGVKWKLNKKVMLRFETAARKTFTDRLDLVSENPINSNLTINNTDQYFNASISIVYSIYPIICPRID